MGAGVELECCGTDWRLGCTDFRLEHEDRFQVGQTPVSKQISMRL
jgi:hypothetical protein